LPGGATIQPFHERAFAPCQSSSRNVDRSSAAGIIIFTTMNRMLGFALVLVAGMLASGAAPAQTSYLRVIAKHLPFGTYDTIDFSLGCPGGSIPVNFTYARRYPYDEDTTHALNLVDSKGQVINRAAIPGEVPLNGGGYAMTIENLEHHDKQFETS